MYSLIFSKLVKNIPAIFSLPMKPGDPSQINTRYMPTLGNGYLGATAYDSKMYLNGLYNGAGSLYFIFVYIY